MAINKEIMQPNNKLTRRELLLLGSFIAANGLGIGILVDSERKTEQRLEQSRKDCKEELENNGITPEAELSQSSSEERKKVEKCALKKIGLPTEPNTSPVSLPPNLFK